MTGAVITIVCAHQASTGVIVSARPDPVSRQAPRAGTVGSARTTRALPSTSPAAAWQASWVPAAR